MDHVTFDWNSKEPVTWVSSKIKYLLFKEGGKQLI